MSICRIRKVRPDYIVVQPRHRDGVSETLYKRTMILQLFHNETNHCGIIVMGDTIQK